MGDEKTTRFSFSIGMNFMELIVMFHKRFLVCWFGERRIYVQHEGKVFSLILSDGFFTQAANE